MQTQSLNGTWQLRHEPLSVIGPRGLAAVGEKTTWLAATVPGEVHLDLMAAGQMDEPLFSTNAPDCRWPEDRSWWLRTRFSVDAVLAGEQVKELVFHGLDYYAQVFLNGALLGESENAFVPAAFDVTHALRDGENELVVRMTAGTERAADQRQGEATPQNIRNNRQTFKGIPELRKPQFTYGWDWVDTLPNIGIWRGVELRGFTHARLHDVRTRCVLPDGDALCLLHVEADVLNLHPWAEHSGHVRIRLQGPDGSSVAEAGLPALLPVGITRLRTTLRVENPRLWWPNTMGDQPLYRLAVDLAANGRDCDSWSRAIGLRTIGIDRSPLPEGHRFAIQVNGRDVFCRGGNWIPADAILARVTPEKLDRLIAEAAEANFTMLRVWGGGIYEDDAFYDACDRRGILVWQDFLFACAPYPDDTVAFQDKIRHEVEAAIRRLRHHPSIALWCANNENTWAFAQWWGNWNRQFPDPQLTIGGRHLYSRVLPEACLNLDPSRPYWPGSPSGGASPDSEIEGDVHWWGPATMNADVNRRIHHELYDECRSRFVSEYGVIGPCQLASIRQYLRPEEVDVSSLAWQVHTNGFEQATTPAAIRHHYADPEGLDIAAYIRYGQMFQAVMYGRSIESMRFRKGDSRDDCAGALIWMFDDCWGENGWTPIDYYLRRKASWYWVRNACLPVRAIVRRRGDELVTRVVNDTLAPVELQAHFGWLAVDGSDRDVQTRELTVPANGMVELGRAAIPDPQQRPHDGWIYAAWAAGEGLESPPCIWTLVPHRRLRTVEPGLEVTVEGRRITLRARAYAHGVRHDDQGERLFSDNYLDLLPGIPRTITCHGEIPSNLHFEPI